MDYNSLLDNIKTFMDNSSLIHIKNSINVPQIAETIATIFKPYKELSDTLHANIDTILPTLAHIGKVSTSYQAVEKLGESQYVLKSLIPQELIDEVLKSKDTEIINIAIENYLEKQEHTQKTIMFINDKINNRVFRQAISAFNRQEYDLAIIGFITVLDRLLSEGSEQIKNVNISSRAKAIQQKFEEKGDFFLADLEARDYALYLTYEKALESFGADSHFLSEEPLILNRHWIMHGRTNREYRRLDCIKVLNMIYGTIRMTELGQEDQINNHI